MSFTHAAAELNLTQTAISHQIRNLEQLLGFKLFVRGGDRLRLTLAGENYFAKAQGIISELSLASEWAMGRQDDTLTIGCLSTFQIKCLLPNLEGFHLQNPNLRLRLKTLFPNLSITNLDCDVAIYYGAAEWPGMVAFELGEELVFPVCSPKLLEQKTLNSPADLKDHTVIRAGSPFLLRDDWPFWLQKAGLEEVDFAKEIQFDFLYPSYQAAIEGLGVMMGRSSGVAHDLAVGNLVEPFRTRIQSPSNYYLIVAEGRRNEPKIAAFITWVLEELVPLLNTALPDIKQ